MICRCFNSHLLPELLKTAMQNSATQSGNRLTDKCLLRRYAFFPGVRAIRGQAAHPWCSTFDRFESKIGEYADIVPVQRVNVLRYSGNPQLQWFYNTLLRN